MKNSHSNAIQTQDSPISAIQAAGSSNIQGFRRFLSRTNAIALAIGVIIGVSTTGLVTSIVQNLINPLLGILLQNVDLNAIQIPLGPDNALKIGAVLSSLINFVITMFLAYQLARLFAKDLVDAKK